MGAVWEADNPVRQVVLALFSGDPVAAEKLPFLVDALPDGLPQLVVQDVAIPAPPQAEPKVG